MSEMQMFIGTFKETEREDIKCVDDDDFYDLEEKHQCHFVSVDGKVYEFHATIEVEPHGFSIVVPASKDNLLILYWYNGGAGVHEVAEEAIRKHLTSGLKAKP